MVGAQVESEKITVLGGVIRRENDNPSNFDVITTLVIYLIKTRSW